MSGLGSARAVARRATLVSERAIGRATGAVRRAQQAPGLTVLLIHNTLGADAARLERCVERHTERFVSFAHARGATDPTPDRAVGPGQVALSFDDGFASNLDMARRLARLGVAACFYVPTDVIGLDKAASDAFFGRPQAEGVLGWADLEELLRLGHVVGSHSRRHVPLAGLSEAQAEDQVKGSLAVLRDRLGAAGHYAWPLGALRYAPVASVVTWCREAGAVAASGVRGVNTPERYAVEGYLRRDAVDLRWLATDLDVFAVRAHRAGRS